jgi:hypothetical protein
MSSLPQDQHRHLDSYLQRTHRRWIFWRILESIGTAAAIACAFAFVLSLILLMRGESGLLLVASCMSVGLITGAILGWIRRPTILNTATEIDHQFGLSDLLATALAIRQSKTFVADSQDQNWSLTVLSIADARSIQLANQSLILRRYGSRAWGGIGLATATVLTLGILSGNPIITRAGNSSLAADDVGSIASSPILSKANAARQQQVPVDNQPESRNSSHIQSTEQPAAAKNDSSTAGDSWRQSKASLNNSGPGIGETSETTHPEKMQLNHSAALSQNASGQPAIGGGDSTKNGHGNANSNAPAADHNSNRSAPNESVNDSTTSQDHSAQKTKSNSIPDSDRDLVHDYFQRD